MDKEKRRNDESKAVYMHRTQSSFFTVLDVCECFVAAAPRLFLWLMSLLECRRVAQRSTGRGSRAKEDEGEDQGEPLPVLTLPLQLNPSLVLSALPQC